MIVGLKPAHLLRSSPKAFFYAQLYGGNRVHILIFSRRCWSDGNKFEYGHDVVLSSAYIPVSTVSLMTHAVSRYLTSPGMARMLHDKLFRFILLLMMMNTPSQLHFLPRRWLSHHPRFIQPLLDLARPLSIGHCEIQTDASMHSFRAAPVRDAHSGAGQET